MSTTIEAFPDNQIREEIGKLMAETVKLAHDQAKRNAEIRETPAERWWYPPVAIGAAAGAGAAVFFILSKLFGV
ncbi:hypothetical protein [Variovorax saccharolyticus]|uniref:hypothetical protein n=1 Tax=Variovorax saccharolyticus TaxID=3053516 RepID=UPI002575C850|nr:hypothetical protein [Variovorax sp. J22R187]MDM0018370.1 hypothetical protein [Variovorax sp. J22R187]